MYYLILVNWMDLPINYGFDASNFWPFWKNYVPGFVLNFLFFQISLELIFPIL